jgi:hypothetical protein
MSWGTNKAGGGLGYTPTATRIPFGNAGGTGQTDSDDFRFDDTHDCLGIGIAPASGFRLLLGGANAKLGLQASSGSPSAALRDGGVDQSLWALDGSLNSLWTLAAGRTGIWSVSSQNVMAMDDARFRVLRRLNVGKSADVVAAGTLTLGNDGNYFVVTGNTNIDHITTTNWTAGSEITLEFTGTPTVNHNTGSPPANTAAIKNDGAANLAMAAGSAVKYQYNGTVWRQVAPRSATGA